MLKYFCIFIFCLFSISCRSEAKIGERATAEDRSGKLTPPASDREPLRLGIRVKLPNLSELAASSIVKNFNAQLAVFDPCLSQTGKGEVVKLSAAFTISRSGLIGDYKILDVVPPSDPFVACFTTHINHLRLNSQSRPVSGELTLGTYYGSASEWSDESQRSE